MKYFKLKSLTFWAAVAEASVNLARVIGFDIPVQVDGIIASIGAVGLRAAVNK